MSRDVWIQVFVSLLVSALALWGYHTIRSGPGDGEASEGAFQAFESRIQALEERQSDSETSADDSSAVTPASSPVDANDLGRLELVVRELERRKLIEHHARAAKAQLRAMGLGLSPKERKSLIEIVTDFAFDRGEFWKRIQRESPTDKEAIARGFKPIRERYTKLIQDAAPDHAEKLIPAILGK